MSAFDLPHPTVDDTKQTLNLAKLKPWAEQIDSSLKDMDALLAALAVRTDDLEDQAAAENAEWRLIMEAGGFFTGLAGFSDTVRYGLSKPSQVAVVGGQNTNPTVIYFDPDEYIRPGKETKLRLSVQGLVNNVNPNTIPLFGLSNITASGGGNNVSALTYAGSVVPGSSVGLNLTSGANARQAQNSNLFDPPAAGFYAITEIASAFQAADSFVAVTAQLKVAYV